MNTIKLFESKNIRSIWNETEEKWYFVVEDVIAILTDSKDPKQYIKRMRMRDSELSKGWVQFVPTLKVETKGGLQKMGCSDSKGLLRIIQSIPSPKAEPFKRWLAQVGEVAGNARKELEKKTGKTIISSENFRQIGEKKQKKLK